MPHSLLIPTRPKKILSKRVKPEGRTTLTISYSPKDAAKLRALADRILIKGGRTPTMSLIARQGIRRYVADLERVADSRPDIFSLEIAELSKGTTAVSLSDFKSK